MVRNITEPKKEISVPNKMIKMKIMVKNPKQKSNKKSLIYLMKCKD